MACGRTPTTISRTAAWPIVARSTSGPAPTGPAPTGRRWMARPRMARTASAEMSEARHPVIVAAIGADLGVDTTRRRAIPRITARAARTIQISLGQSDPAVLEVDHDAG